MSSERTTHPIPYQAKLPPLTLSPGKGSFTDKLKNVFHHKKDHENPAAEEQRRDGLDPDPVEGQKREGEFQKFENYVKKSQAEEARDQAKGDEYGGDM